MSASPSVSLQGPGYSLSSARKNSSWNLFSGSGGILLKLEVVPLTDLLKGKTTFVWSPVCQEAFERVCYTFAS